MDYKSEPQESKVVIDECIEEMTRYPASVAYKRCIVVYIGQESQYPRDSGQVRNLINPFFFLMFFMAPTCSNLN